ncbi:MAG: hypothetical protein IPL86_19270 [Flavobacteriales bacterium]|nr:hypothetical protein [Flavobacteriales bacterium]
MATKDKITLPAARRQELMDAAEADEDYDLTVWPKHVMTPDLQSHGMSFRGYLMEYVTE